MLAVALVAIPPGPAVAQFDTPYGEQSRQVRYLLPAPLDQGRVASHGPQPSRPARIRFFADPQYRAAVVRWEDKIRALLARVNQFTGPAFGVTFETAGLLKWERRAPAERLEPILVELEALDPGEGVDFVVGLVAPLALVSSSHHHVGEARLGGKHFVMRGIVQLDEAKDLGRYYDLIDEKDRDSVLRARQQHRDTGICCALVREAGQEPGARDACARVALLSKHDHDPGPLLDAAEAYARGDDPGAAHEAAKEARARIERRGQVPPATWARLGRVLVHLSALAAASEALERAGQGEAAADEARVHLARLRRRLGVPEGATGLAAGAEPDYAEAFWRASEALGKNDIARAGRLVNELVERFPSVAGVVALRCEFELRSGRRALGARLCKEALRLFPETTRALFALAYLDAQQGKRAAAAAGFEKVMVLDPDFEAPWSALARLYRNGRKSRELADLAQRYQAHFGRALTDGVTDGVTDGGAR